MRKRAALYTPGRGRSATPRTWSSRSTTATGAEVTCSRENRRGATAQPRQAVQDDPVVVDPKARGQLRLALELGITAPIERIDDLPGSPVDEHESRLGQQPLPEGQEEGGARVLPAPEGQTGARGQEIPCRRFVRRGHGVEDDLLPPVGIAPAGPQRRTVQIDEFQILEVPFRVTGARGLSLSPRWRPAERSSAATSEVPERCMPTMMRGCERNGRALIRATRYRKPGGHESARIHAPLVAGESSGLVRCRSCDRRGDAVAKPIGGHQ